MVFLKRGHTRRGPYSETGDKEEKGGNQDDQRCERMNTPPIPWKTAVGIEDGDEETPDAKRNLSVFVLEFIAFSSMGPIACTYTVSSSRFRRRKAKVRRQLYKVRSRPGPARTPLADRPPYPKRFHAMVSHGASILGRTSMRKVHTATCSVCHACCVHRSKPRTNLTGK